MYGIEFELKMTQGRGHVLRRKTPTVIKILLLPIIIPIVCVLIWGQCLRALFSSRPVRNNSRSRNFIAEVEHARADLAERELLSEAPPMLPVIRKRALTIPLPPIPIARQLWQKAPETYDQSQSSFFRRLPPEVREQIYRICLVPDQRSLHIFRRTDKRLGHYFCTNENGMHRLPQLFKWEFYKEPYGGTGAWRKEMNIRSEESSSLLSLIKTCRRAYTEAVHTLYAANVFCLQDHRTLQYFRLTVLPQSLLDIKKIQLPWIYVHAGFPGSIAQLNMVLQMLNSRFPSLKEIRLLHETILANGVTPRSFYEEAENLIAQTGQKTLAKIIVDAIGATRGDSV